MYVRFKHLAGCAAILFGVTAATAQITFDVTITADNQYGLYTGDVNSASTYVGGEFATLASQIATPESYNLTLPNSGYIYITSWSDLAVYQGVLAEFSNSMGSVLTGDPEWEVFATGVNRANGAAPVTLADMTTQIGIANGGGGPSSGWQPTAIGNLNNSGSLWGFGVGGISPNANWIWYDSGNDPSANAPFVGFDHDEFLIFRLPVNVPEPTSLALLACGGLLAVMRRR